MGSLCATAVCNEDQQQQETIEREEGFLYKPGPEFEPPMLVTKVEQPPVSAATAAPTPEPFKPTPQPAEARTPAANTADVSAPPTWDAAAAEAPEGSEVTDTEAPPEIDFRPGSQEENAERQKQRKKRIEVANGNYQLRNNWTRPKNLYVPFQQCQNAEVTPQAEPSRVTFSSWCTADALLHFARSTDPVQHRVCALNFANGERVGGGYKTGALAQEEDLCRRLPNLYNALNNAKREGCYPFGPCTCTSADDPQKYSDVLYTSGLVVARLSEEQDFKLLDSAGQARNVALVSAAAPNINFAKEVYDLELMYNTVRAIFVAPLMAKPETDVLILGAWGCGAFGGNPADISGLFARALTSTDLGRLYAEVHFAIPRCDAGDRNGDIFRETLQKHNIAFTELAP